MRRRLGSIFLALVVAAVAAHADAGCSPARTRLTVVLYPFVPAKEAYFRQVESAFEEQHPTIDLEILDLSANYYDEDSPDAVTNTFADVIELDSVFLDDFVATGRIRGLPDSVKRPEGTFLPAAEEAVTLDGKTFALPHWVCSNFLFSSVRDPVAPANLRDLAAAIGETHEADRGLLIDLEGRSTLGEWYLDALLDRRESLAAAAPYLTEAAADRSVYSDLARVRGLCDGDLCRQSRYHAATGFYPVQLARHRGRALAGYSERLYYIGMEDLTNCKKGECLDLTQVRISPLPLSDRGSQPFAWVDSFAVARGCTGRCLSAAEAFLGFMAEPANVRATLTPGDGEAPRYLLPALKSLYSDAALLGVAPLYAKLYPLIENAIPVRAPHLNRHLRAIGEELDNVVLPP